MIVSEDPSTTETYGFTLTPANNAARTGLADGTITFTSTDVTDEARVSGGKNGQPVAFVFGDMKFSKTGTFVFNVNETSLNGETLPADRTDGMTYDRHTCTVTVVVGDKRPGCARGDVCHLQQRSGRRPQIRPFSTIYIVRQ